MQYMPEYQCKINEQWQSCNRDTICNQNLEYTSQWRINYDSDKSFKNWVDPDKFDLTCVDGFVIALPATSYFIGYVISAGFISPLADRFGRKWPFIIS